MKNIRRKPEKIIRAIIAGLLLSYLVVFLFPQLVFGHKLTHGNFTVYSHTQLVQQIFPILNQAEKLINQSELADGNLAKQRLFLCSNFLEYTFFAPSNFRSFASYNPISGNILIAKPGLPENKAARNGPENNVRSLSGVIAHELTHALIRNEFGLLKEAGLAKWKKEGYCDFIAQESSFNPDTGMTIFCQNQNDRAPAFQYFKYRLYVQYLLLDQKISFKKLVISEFDLKELDQAVRKNQCSEKEI